MKTNGERATGNTNTHTQVRGDFFNLRLNTINICFLQYQNRWCGNLFTPFKFVNFALLYLHKLWLDAIHCMYCKLSHIPALCSRITLEKSDTIPINFLADVSCYKSLGVSCLLVRISAHIKELLSVLHHFFLVFFYKTEYCQIILWYELQCVKNSVCKSSWLQLLSV